MARARAGSCYTSDDPPLAAVAEVHAVGAILGLVAGRDAETGDSACAAFPPVRAVKDLFHFVRFVATAVKRKPFALDGGFDAHAEGRPVSIRRAPENDLSANSAII